MTELTIGIKRWTVTGSVLRADGSVISNWIDGQGLLSEPALLKASGQFVSWVARALDATVLVGPISAGGALALVGSIFASTDGLACRAGQVRGEARAHGPRSDSVFTIDIGLNDRVLVVDDVLGTGTTVQHAIDAVVKTCASVVGVAVLVDRGEASLYAVDQARIVAAVPWPLITRHETGMHPALRARRV